MHTKAYEGISFDMSHKNLVFTTMQHRRFEMSYYVVNYSFELMKEIEEAPSGRCLTDRCSSSPYSLEVSERHNFGMRFRPLHRPDMPHYCWISHNLLLCQETLFFSRT